MTRSELIERLTVQFPTLTQDDVATAVAVFLEAITTALASDDRVEIRGFGSFCVNHRPPRLGRNPRTGVSVEVPAKLVPHFKPGKDLRQRVDKKVNPPHEPSRIDRSRSPQADQPPAY